MKKYNQIQIFGVIIIGVILVVAQFFYNRNIWGDEAILALDLLNNNFHGLLKPLGLTVSPILFLMIEKTATLVVPNTEIALKIFPLISFFLALFFLFNLLKSVVKNDLILVISIALFVFNLIVIRYATEIKQYMNDVFITSLLFYLTLRSAENLKGKYLLLALTGTLAIFISHITVIVLVPVGLILLIEQIKSTHKNLRPLILCYSAWVLSFSVYYYFFIYNHPSSGLLTKHWIYKGGFMPLDLFSPEFNEFSMNKFAMIFRDLFSFGTIGNYLLPVLLLLGIANLLMNKRYNLLIISLLPPFIHLLLSGFKIYPVATRLILYQLPGFIILIGSGFELMVTLSKVRINSMLYKFLMIFIPAVLLSALLFLDYPFKINNVKMAMNYVAQNRKEGDTVLVGRSVISIYEFYQITEPEAKYVPIQKIPFNSKKHQKQYIEYLKSVTGRKWIMFTKTGPKLRKNIFDEIDNPDMKKLDEFVSWGSSAYLFDFGHPPPKDKPFNVSKKTPTTDNK